VRSTAAAPMWAWEMEGPPGAPTLLLLHGWMATAALNWYAALPYLSHQFRLVAPNLRGHGREGCGAPPFSLDSCSDDLAALIDELRVQRAIAVGYSMGGAVAQVMARRHREVLDGIVLCATGASFARRVKLRPLVRATGKVISGAARRHPSQAAAFLRWRLARHDRVAAAERARGPAGAAGGAGGLVRNRAWAMEERSHSHLAAFIEAGAELNAYDSSSWLPTLDLPAAVVVTARDRIVAPWRQDAMAALIHGARRYSVDAGHDAVATSPELFLPVLARACSELAQANGNGGAKSVEHGAL
jgi:3-oxoadipate enol-lactonase